MNSAPPQYQLKPLRLSELLDTVLSLYGRNFWLFVLVVGALEVPLQALTYLLRLPLPGEPTALIRRSAHHLTKAQLHIVFHWLVPQLGITLLLALVALVVVTPLQEAALTKAVSDRYLGQQTSLGAAYRFALGRWVALLGMTVLIAVMYLIGLLVVVLLAVILHVVLGRFGTLLDVIVVLAALVAGVAVFVRLSLAVPVLVLERVPAVAALQRSWSLTRGGAWRALGVILVLGIIEFLAGFVLGLVLNLLASLGGGVGHRLGAFIFDLGSLASTVALAPIVLVGLVLLYFDFRVRREQFDSEQLAAHLGG